MKLHRPRPQRITTAALLQGRFTGLMIILLLILFSMSVVTDRGWREIITGFGFSVLTLFAIWSVRPRLRVVTIALAIPTLIGHWIPQLSSSPVLRAVAFGFATIFLAYLTLLILLAVFRDGVVTADTIVGAVCAYVLLGVTWGTSYALLDLVSPDAFSISPALARTADWTSPATPFTPLMQYYSFTTLATLGFGDVSPLTAGARALSVLEGLTGQLYLAVLIARLVGMHSARSGNP